MLGTIDWQLMTFLENLTAPFKMEATDCSETSVTD